VRKKRPRNTSRGNPATETENQPNKSLENNPGAVRFTILPEFWRCAIGAPAHH